MLVLPTPCDSVKLYDGDNISFKDRRQHANVEPRPLFTVAAASATLAIHGR
jgi:hypothetical protein